MAILLMLLELHWSTWTVHFQHHFATITCLTMYSNITTLLSFFFFLTSNDKITRGCQLSHCSYSIFKKLQVGILCRLCTEDDVQNHNGFEADYGSYFFFRPLAELKCRGEGGVLPVLLARQGLLLMVSIKKWDRVLIRYCSPALMLECQLWVTDYQNRLCPQLWQYGSDLMSDLVILIQLHVMNGESYVCGFSRYLQLNITNMSENICFNYWGLCFFVRKV